ncbi:MAG: hypothetical protein KIS86_10610 [Devosia sp.]|nr:hypothetical protein [Devosia sp.]
MPVKDRSKCSARKRLPPLSIRFTEAERAELEKLSGTQPLSAFIKSKIFYGGAEKPKVALARILAALGSSDLASSLERLSRAADAGSLYVDDDTVRALHRAFNQIASMHFHLLCALGKRPKHPPAFFDVGSEP